LPAVVSPGFLEVVVNSGESWQLAGAANVPRGIPSPSDRRKRVLLLG